MLGGIASHYRGSSQMQCLRMLPPLGMPLHKEQHGNERNFSFLKAPLIVNDLFLNWPDCIEALGFILLASLLTWNLMEHVMREHLKLSASTVCGWDRRLTTTSLPPGQPLPYRRPFYGPRLDALFACSRSNFPDGASSRIGMVQSVDDRRFSEDRHRRA